MSRVLRELPEVSPYLSHEEIEAFKRVTQVYPFSTTEYYLKIAKNSPAVKKMVIPSVEEIDPEIQRHGEDDPLNEEKDSPTPYLTHRYPDRVLLVTTNYCPVLCRYCMRKRNWKKPVFTISEKELEKAVSYIRRNSRIRDVLISGGDPLTLPVELLKELLEKLKAIDHVEVVRIGTRIPVVDPERVLDGELLKTVERAEKVWINTHFNHPDELTEESKEAIRALLKCGAPVNNQTVLLKKVNDSVEVLEKLFRELQKAKVRPYYLFHCDPVKGVMHFSTPITKGLEILRELFKRLSPLAIPYYAVDGPGGYGKVPLLPHRFRVKNGKYLFESFNGNWFEMEDR